MRASVVLSALAAVLVAGGCGENPKPRAQARFWPDRVAYAYDLAWDDRRGVLSGTGTVRFANTGRSTLREVWLRTWPNAYAKPQRPLAQMSRVRGGRLAGARHGRTAQRIALSSPVAPGARGRIAFDVAVTVPRRGDRFGRVRDAAYLGSALPTLAVAGRDGWRLPPFARSGEAWFTLASEWRVRVRTRLAVAATGTRKGDWLVAHRARDFALVIGHLTRTERTVDGVRLNWNALPGGHRRDAERALDAGAAALRAFERWYGPYGRAEVDLVQGPAHVAARGIAMEYPELVLTPPAGAAIAHELAHQWWGMIMGNDPYREPWLDEAFAEYSAARLPRSVTGGDRLRGCRGVPHRPRPPIDASMAVWDRAPGRAYARTVYIGGACMLRRLEARLGRARYDGLLRGLVAEHRDGTWDAADLRAAVRRADPGALPTIDGP